jgi:hypothetical protein
MMQRAQLCPGVIQLVGCFEDREEVHLVTEVCRGGDLKQFVEVGLWVGMLEGLAKCQHAALHADMHACLPCKCSSALSMQPCQHSHTMRRGTVSGVQASRV